jgi:TM2 domain-containing membrane protein YozV
MANVLHVLPDLDGDELGYVQLLMADMTEEEAMQFALMYRARRKDPQMILILTLIGFLGFAGIQRFVVGQIGLGVLYFFTGGLCLIGVIVDLVNYRRIASDYNQKQAYEVALIMRRFAAPRAS